VTAALASAIIERWRQAVCTSPSASGLSREDVVDTLAAYLDALPPLRLTARDTEHMNDEPAASIAPPARRDTARSGELATAC
jgi:hypothetical protein